MTAPHDLDWSGLLDRSDAAHDIAIAEDVRQQLPAADQQARTRSALAHLQCAVGQSLPSDDQIIMEHVRTAIALLKPVAWPESGR